MKRLALLALLLCLPTPARAMAPLPGGLGTAIGWDCCTAVEVAPLRPHWFTDYHPAWDTSCLSPARGIAALLGAARVNMAWTWMPDACFTTQAARQLGSAWILGNEPNVAGQDTCGGPTACAARYRQMAAAIRAGDPTAALISPGLGQGSELAWAQALHATGGDLWATWNLHYYAPPTVAGAAWVLAQLDTFHVWQTGRGDMRPLVLGEIGIAPTTTGDGPAYLRALTQGINARPWVRAWAWFSVRAAGRWPGDLLAGDGTLTPLGGAFRALAMLGAPRPRNAWRGN